MINLIKWLFLWKAVILGYLQEAIESWSLTLVDIHVLELWRNNSALEAKLSNLAHVDSLLDISSLREFLLVHAKFFLMFLEADVDAVNEYFTIDVILNLLLRLYWRWLRKLILTWLLLSLFLMWLLLRAHLEVNEIEKIVLGSLNLCLLLVKNEVVLGLRLWDLLLDIWMILITMYELASLPVWTKTVWIVLLTMLGLVKSWYVTSDHYLLFAMGKWTLY